jgi:general secretion pathway protein H
MIVLVLAGLLSGIVATSMSKGPVLRKTAYEIANNLRYARNLALIQQREIVWKVDINDKKYGITESNQANQTKSLETDFTLRVDSAASENSHKTLAGIRFFPDGSSTGGKITLIYKKQRYSINVEWLSGRISIQ